MPLPAAGATGILEVESLTMNQFSLGYLAAGIGAGLAVLGAGFGIGRLASAAMEGTARQPSAGGDIRTSMIIAAALIEGVTLFAEVVCIILAVKV
jgi:F-type H+-transporting ATPase subunit c